MKINWDIVVIILLIIFLFSLLFIGKIVKGVSGQCLKSPLTFGVKEIQKQNGVNLSCVCTVRDKSATQFFVDDKEIKLYNPIVTPISDIPSYNNSWMDKLKINTPA